eukprot:9930128-Lingulodinium_polyedra.AAC.1
MPATPPAKKRARRGSLPATAAVVPTVDNQVNTAMLAEVEKSLEILKGHPVLHDLMSAKPCGIADGASLPAFNSTDFKDAMSRQPFEYRCSGNFLWQSCSGWVNQQVRIIPRSVETVKAFHYDSLAAGSFRVVHEVVIGIPEEDTAYNVEKHFGALHRLSPPEFLLAALFRARELVQAGITDSDMRMLKKALCSCIMVFRKLPSSTMKYAAMQLRENLATDADAVDWTALQRIQCVMAERDSLQAATGKMPTAQAVSAKLDENVSVSSRNEKYSKSFVDCALTATSLANYEHLVLGFRVSGLGSGFRFRV